MDAALMIEVGEDCGLSNGNRRFRVLHLGTKINQQNNFDHIFLIWLNIILDDHLSFVLTILTPQGI